MSLRIFLPPILLFSLLNAAPVHALDLGGASGTLGDSFDFLLDPNEGSTVFRSLNIPSGGRVEGLGTAAVALPDDISFFDYNPAASSVLERTELAVFHNAWISDSAMETLAAASRSGNLGYGAQLRCFYVPFTEYNLYGDRVAGSYYTETTAALNASYNFLAGYNFRGLAVGGNVRAGWRGVPDYTDNKTDEIISGSGLSQSALALMADLGALVRFDFLKNFADRSPNLCVGLSVMSLGAAITGFGDSVGLDDSLPARISAGFSYRIFAPVLLTAEFRKPFNILDFASSGSWSACAGFEIGITRFFSLDAGFLLQGANPRISMGSGFLVRSVQMNVNYTFDLTSSQNPVNHISLSAKLRLGDGGREKVRDEVTAHYVNGLRLYAEGDLPGAIEQWDRAIALDPRFDPALEAKSAAVRFNSAKQDIMDMQQLDIGGAAKLKR